MPFNFIGKLELKKPVDVNQINRFFDDTIKTYGPVDFGNKPVIDATFKMYTPTFGIIHLEALQQFNYTDYIIINGHLEAYMRDAGFEKALGQKYRFWYTQFLTIKEYKKYMKSLPQVAVQN